MRWGLVLAAGLAGCFATSRYAVVRPGLRCDRATRVAYRTMQQLGYQVIELTSPEADRPGVIRGRREGPDGEPRIGEVRITCSGAGVELQPIEDSPFPDFEFSRHFDYSFTNLVQQPDVAAPTAAGGLQVEVRAVDHFEARLDLGGVPTHGDAVPVRVTVRNDTDRTVAVDPADVDLTAADGTVTAPLAGPALDAAIAAGSAGDRVRAELLAVQRVAPHTTVSRFLVFPPGSYKEARISLTDVETEETEGFVTPVE